MTIGDDIDKSWIVNKAIATSLCYLFYVLVSIYVKLFSVPFE